MIGTLSINPVSVVSSSRMAIRDFDATLGVMLSEFSLSSYSGE
jgi:hypothetical protein